ncbi:MAG: hypothetical protein HS119_00215 [Flavobacteriales bacterium]|nr:hypothetical protein [Flavobacteriales bacterium]MCL4856225.1 hypothetical protein [Flavobacteriales bacterium]
MKKTVKLILIALTIFATKVNAQDNKGQAPAMQLANYVNPFTGDFSYSIPLIGVTGPNGESFPLNLNYAGGIKVDQQASWVGLGWDLNIGEISRQVNGLPDDFNNVRNFKDTYYSSGTLLELQEKSLHNTTCNYEKERTKETIFTNMMLINNNWYDKKNNKLYISVNQKN